MGVMIEKLKHMFKPITLLLFLLPIVAAVGVGSLLEKQQKELVIPIAIVDEDQTDFSGNLIKQMELQQRIVVKETSFDEADTLLSRNEVDSIFVLKKGFQAHILDDKRKESIELWTSPTSIASGIVREVVASEVTKVTSSVKAANRVEKLYQQEKGIKADVWDEAFEYTKDQLDPKPLMTINYVSENSIAGTQNKDVLFTSYLGVWSFFTMLSCFITSDWVVKERSVLFPRIMTTNIGLASYLRQTSGAYILFHVLQAACSLMVLRYFQLMETTLFLYLGMVLFIVFTTSISMWTASRMHHLGSYYVAGSLMAFILAIAGGSFFPIGDISPTFEFISLWLPQKILWVTAYPLYTSFSEIGWTVLFSGVCIALLWKTTNWGLNVR
ncbi:ABC transporter permease [Peribacillus sp. NPDC097264]|uniref:ABC transporter permease n=1 Tax=Peribacillus sp. NPDC097264 TaxID=3390616 RepID=UPI003D0112A0